MAYSFIRAINSASRKKVLREQARAVEAEIKKIFEGAVGDGIQKQFETATRKWKNKPVYERSVKVKPAQIILTVGPVARGSLPRWPKRPSAEQIFELVDKGTEPHLIAARLAPRLRFQAEYKPITTPPPGTIAQRTGGPGRATGAQVTALVVKHPGTEPRHFGRQIVKQYQPIFRVKIESAIRKAVRRERARSGG